jgi:hypothetical protein
MRSVRWLVSVACLPVRSRRVGASNLRILPANACLEFE